MFQPAADSSDGAFYRPEFLVSRLSRNLPSNFMGRVNDEQDWRESNGDYLKAPESNMADGAELIEADVFAPWLFYIASKYYHYFYKTNRALPKCSLFVMINSITNSSDDDDSKQKNRRYPNFSNKCRMLRDFLQ